MNASFAPMSQHFSLLELEHSQIASRKGVPNAPNADQILNLVRLCKTLLDPARDLLNVPLQVDSGFRSPILNTLVGGASDSAHMDGRAADVIPLGLDLHQAFEELRVSSLPYDELIIECNEWLHLAIAVDRALPRRRALTASGSPGHWVYTLA